MMIYLKPFDPDFEESWNHAKDMIRKIRNLVAERGIPLYVAIMEDIVQLNDDLWASALRRYSFKGKTWDRGQPQRLMKGFFRSIDVPFVDLKPEFARRGGADSRFNIRTDDDHWNVLGHRTVAEIIAADLRRQHLIPQ